MNHDELWAAIDAQRLRTADLLDELTAEEWDLPSLCDGWTVRVVAAHLTLQQLTLGSAIILALRHPGSTNHLIDASSRARQGCRGPSSSQRSAAWSAPDNTSSGSHRSRR